MDTIDAGRCTLVLVDYQARLMPAIHDSQAVVGQARLLADTARIVGVRVVGTVQNPRHLGAKIDDLRARCDVTIAKMHFDACQDGLVETLDSEPGAATQVVIAGCEAHVCLLQTALGLLRAGRRVWVAESACGSRRPSDRRLAMQRLAAAGATIVSPEMAVFEWLRNCRHPDFKSVLRLVKDAGPTPQAPNG